MTSALAPADPALDRDAYLAAGRRVIAIEAEALTTLAASLDALSPLKVLGRGYAIVRHEDGGVVRSVKEVMPGERLTLRVTDGTIDVTASS